MTITPYSLPVEIGTDGKLRARKDQHEAAVNGALSPLDARVTATEVGIDGVNAALSTLSDQVSQIETGSADGIIVASTLANLEAQAVSHDLGPDDSGRGGRVYADSDPNNNGDYGWTGGSWSLLGVDRIGKVEAATGAPLDVARYPDIYDPLGIYSGGVETYYVPRSLYARRGANVLNGSSFGTASTPFPNHVALAVTTVNPATVYLDFDDNSAPQKIVNWPTLPSALRSDKIDVIAEIFQRRVKTSRPVIYIEDVDKEHIAFRWDIAIDNGKVLVPPVYHYSASTGFTFYQPSTGELYWELDLNTSQTSEWRYYFDRVAAENGEVPVKVANSGTTRPLAAGNHAVILEFGRSVNGNFDSKHSVVGAGGIGSVPNMLLHGNDPDLAPRYDPALTTSVDIANADIVALGFTRGFGGTRPMPRMLLPESTPKVGWGFARCIQLASSDNAFVAPIAYLHNGRMANLVQFTAFMEKKISARVAIFCRMFQYSLNEPPAAVTFGNTTDSVVNTGFQIHVGSQGHPWIMRGDYARSIYPDILYPAKHYSVEGRPLPFFRSNMISDRFSDERIIAYKPGDNLTGLPWSQEIGEATTLDYDVAPANINLILSGSRSNPSQRVRAEMEIIRASGAMSGAFNVLHIGDSNTARGLPSRVKRKLTEMGFTPTMVGTILDEQDGEYGEGRGSWEWDDFYGADPQFPAVPIGDEAAYLALAADNGNAAGRWGKNALLNGDGDFDIPTYLSRLGVATPKYIPVLLGTNDINLNSVATAIAQIELGMEKVIPSALAVSGSVCVGLGIMPMPLSVGGDAKWREAYAQAIRTMIQYVNDTASSRLDILPVWAHMSPDFGWSLQTKQTYANRTLAEITDDLHPQDINRAYAAECIAQWIACKETGG